MAGPAHSPSPGPDKPARLESQHSDLHHIVRVAGIFSLKFKVRRVGWTGEQGRIERPEWRLKQGTWPPLRTTSKKRLTVNPLGQENNYDDQSRKCSAKSFACMISYNPQHPTKSVHILPLLQRAAHSQDLNSGRTDHLEQSVLILGSGTR